MEIVRAHRSRLPGEKDAQGRVSRGAWVYDNRGAVGSSEQIRARNRR
jgi:hypothetical protein